MTIQWPKHNASMHITHNQHKAYYKTVKECVDKDDHGYRDWVSDEEKQKAIEADECWHLQYYPKTPVGFWNISASTFEALMDYVKKEEKK